MGRYKRNKSGYTLIGISAFSFFDKMQKLGIPAVDNKKVFFVNKSLPRILLIISKIFTDVFCDKNISGFFKLKK